MSRRDREADAADVVCEALSIRAPDARELLVGLDPTGRVAAAVAARGATVHEWLRWARAGAAAAQPWPSATGARVGTLRLPKGREALEMALQALVEATAPGALLLVYGANDEGARSCAPLLEARLEQVHTVLTKRHCRVWQGRRPDHTPIRGLEAWLTRSALETPAGDAELWSAPGLFAHGRLDNATGLLLESLPPIGPGARVLDYGCGAGAIGWAIRAQQPGTRLTLLDRDALAIHCAIRNLPEATQRLGDGFAALSGERFDWIVSNPPLHEGKSNAPRLLVDFVRGAAAHLAPGGTIVLVTHRSGPAAKLLAEHFRECEVLRETRSTRVWLARAPRT